MADDVAAPPTALVEATPPLSAMLGLTRYFEINSRIAGARYAVWVTIPPQYLAASGQRFPVIYQPDGNMSAAAHGSVHAMACADLINPLKPFIQVCIGYTGADARLAGAVRVRDLLPPGEPPLDGMDARLKLAVAAGQMEKDLADLMLHNMANTAADRFLAFITDELHPLIARDWRVDEDDAALYGYSYGGLFALYAALTRPPLFRKIGSGSPGVQAGKSKIFTLYDAARAAGDDHSGRRLHVSICEREITRPTMYQPVIGLGTVEFLTRAGQTPLKGLTLTTRMVNYKSHISGVFTAWYSFLRDSYSAAQA